MSQFVDIENQNLLWRMAHKIPEFDNMRSKQRGLLFKQTIQQVYDSISKQELTREELQSYNRSVLSQLVKQLRTSPPPISKPPLHQQSPPHSQPQSQPQPFVESKEELFQRQFQAKQHEYESMNAKPNMPDASELFKEKVDEDERIENMDELIKQYETQRQQDMQDVMTHIHPPPTTTPSEPTSSEHTSSEPISSDPISSEPIPSDHISSESTSSISSPLQLSPLQLESLTQITEKLNQLEQRIIILEKSNNTESDSKPSGNQLRKSI